MNEPIFIGANGATYGENLFCTGVLPAELDGKPCPFAVNGGMPAVQPLDGASEDYSVDKGRHGDLCPPCVKQSLGSLGHWNGHAGQQYPIELHPLRLFKCRRWFWLVVPGLRDDAPTEIVGSDG